jgi:hypothetical protein
MWKWAVFTPVLKINLFRISDRNSYTPTIILWLVCRNNAWRIYLVLVKLVLQTNHHMLHGICNIKLIFRGFSQILISVFKLCVQVVRICNRKFPCPAKRPDLLMFVVGLLERSACIRYDILLERTLLLHHFNRQCLIIQATMARICLIYCYCRSVVK